MNGSETRITDAQFLSAFSAEWYAAIDAGGVPPDGPYGDREKWKEFIEGPKGLLARMLVHFSESTHIQYRREAVFRFDVCFVADGDRPNPVGFIALIEHELNNDPQNEMQKLILARAPLKVLLFYDWSEEEKKVTDNRQNWVDEKLCWFAEALIRANAACPENPATKYVFLIGRRKSSQSQIEWRKASTSDGLSRPSLVERNAIVE